MNDLVDRILISYQVKRRLDPELVADSRRKIRSYLETLESVGKRDPEQLTMYGLAYLKQMHEARDPKFTGC